MPQLIFKGVKKEDVKSLSASLLAPLSEIASAPADYFTFECVENSYFKEGNEWSVYPLIEIIQFDRGVEVESKMAETIAQQVKSLGYPTCEIFFTYVFKDRYFEF